MKITRKDHLSPIEFLGEHVIGNIPVVLSSSLDKETLDAFSPDTLVREFGDFEAQVYDDLFELQTISTIGDYIEDNFNNEDSHEYLRGYCQFKDADFFWTDDLFNAQKDKWKQPECLPSSDFLVPCVALNQIRLATHGAFPYKGLFLSGKGARTRLHRDPLMSNAVLCQFYGTKRIVMYAPDQKPFLENDGEVADFDNPNLDMFPNFYKAEISFQDVLSPGEVVFFPAGWYHHVVSETDSISVTWNFVTSAESERFMNYLKTEISQEELTVLDFFYSAENIEGPIHQEVKEVIQMKLA